MFVVTSDETVGTRGFRRAEKMSTFKGSDGENLLIFPRQFEGAGRVDALCHG